MQLSTSQNRPKYIYKIGPKVAFRSEEMAKSFGGSKTQVKKVSINEFGQMKFGPFLIKGDFNGDGYEDLAVTLVESGIPTRDNDSGPFSVAVFNGTSVTYSNPIFILRRFNLSWGDLGYIPKNANGGPVLRVNFPWGGGGITYTWRNGNYIKEVHLGP